MTLALKIDYRLGGTPKYRLVGESDNLMQIPDEIRKSVVFICYKAADGMKLAGTAFFISITVKESGILFSYIITAKHIIDGIRSKSINQKVYLRINLKVGGADLVETPIENWLMHPTESDVDVAILNWAPSQETFDYRFIPLEMAATQEIIKTQNIGVGDDVFLTGLFRNHYGSQRNMPIIRVGNIASMPEEKVHTTWGDIDAYLIEARSIGGLSGSPVFAFIGSMRRIDGAMHLGRSGYLFYLLGLMHGHFDLSHLELDDLSRDSLINLQINIGIAIVVPVWKIIEVMNQKALIDMRELTIRKEQGKILSTLDTSTDISPIVHTWSVNLAAISGVFG